MHIKIFTTGGTIDKIYFDQKNDFQVGEPQIIEVLKEANITCPVDVESLFRKDSLDLTDSDREKIRQAVKKESGSMILITHGTDTMIKTAIDLIPVQGKTIVLTGSMQPAKLKNSDAVFNIGYALAAVQTLPAGVYIAMNGCLFDPRLIQKNVEKNIFEKKG